MTKGCNPSTPLTVFSFVVWLVFSTGASLADIVQETSIRPSTVRISDRFGHAVAVSGSTMVVGSPFNDTNQSGAVYVFVRDGANWKQQAFLKPPQPGFALFGYSVGISGDTIVIGAPAERSSATGVNGNQNDTSLPNAGAAYVFTRNGTNWTQQAYLKASNTEREDQFGRAVAIAGDTVAVGAPFEASSATGINGDQNNNNGQFVGAVYLFARTGTTWAQQAYVKASNSGSIDQFGSSVALFGETLVVGARGERSSAAGVNGNQNDDSLEFAGAAYVFVRSGATWTQQAYLKASNPGFNDHFGDSVAISGNTIVVGADFEWSAASGVNGDQNDNSKQAAGAAYVFVRNGTTWTQQAYLKASNPDAVDFFALSVAISGNTIVIGAPDEDSAATGVNGNQDDNSFLDGGAAYVFVRYGTTWTQHSYLKALNPNRNGNFGYAVGISDGAVIVGAPGEGNYAGTVYSFVGLDLPPPDTDGDGVPDPDDECPDTLPGAIVDASGCSIDQLVPCDGPWRNHAHFLSALRQVTSDFLAAGLITEDQRRAIIRAGTRSDCGKR